MTDEFNRIPGGRAKAVLLYLARQLVDEPEEVSVEVADGSPVRLTLQVAPNDVGRVIGRRGRTARALRAVTRAAASREGDDVLVDIAG
ncbi:MAG: KH domain-containing protein [Acidimicrobiales bacterium]